jgi:hypothetical protein
MTRMKSGTFRKLSSCDVEVRIVSFVICEQETCTNYEKRGCKFAGRRGDIFPKWSALYFYFASKYKTTPYLSKVGVVKEKCASRAASHWEVLVLFTLLRTYENEVHFLFYCVRILQRTSLTPQDQLRYSLFNAAVFFCRKCFPFS